MNPNKIMSGTIRAWLLVVCCCLPVAGCQQQGPLADSQCGRQPTRRTTHQDLADVVRLKKQTVDVLIAYYSMTGNTERMAQAVAEGVKRVRGAVPLLKRVSEVTREDLEAADAIVLGCPTWYANIPGRMKIVIDDWSWKMKVDFTDKAGGAFATGGGQMGGKEHVVISLLLFMINNRMIVAGPLYQDEDGVDLWAETGAGAMTGPIDIGIGVKELDSATRLGERIAHLALKLKK